MVNIKISILMLPIEINDFEHRTTFYLILCFSMKILPYYNTIFLLYDCSAAVGQYVDPNQSFLLSYSNHLPRTLVPSVDLKKKLYIYTRFFALNVLRYNRFVNKKWQYIFFPFFECWSSEIYTYTQGKRAIGNNKEENTLP